MIKTIKKTTAFRNKQTMLLQNDEVMTLVRNIIFANYLTSRRVACNFNVQKARKRYTAWFIANQDINENIDVSIVDGDIQ